MTILSFRWLQWKDQKATVGRLTKVLFNHREYEAISCLQPWKLPINILLLHIIATSSSLASDLYLPVWCPSPSVSYWLCHHPPIRKLSDIGHLPVSKIYCCQLLPHMQITTNYHRSSIDTNPYFEWSKQYFKRCSDTFNVTNYQWVSHMQKGCKIGFSSSRI